MNFTMNVNEIYKKANQGLFMRRKLRGFEVSTDILERVYVILIESVLVFISLSLTVVSKNKLYRIVRNAGQLIGQDQKQLDLLNQIAMHRIAKGITSDAEHPLFDEFCLMPSECHYRTKYKEYSIVQYKENV